MKSHLEKNNKNVKQWIIFYGGNEFQITKYKNVEGIMDNQSFFLYRKIRYKTYEGCTPYKHKTLIDAKKSIKLQKLNKKL